jgi:hypothetical protein
MPDYLVQYGTSAFVGRFTATIEPMRGASVLLRTPRGSELGTVLCEAKANAAFDGSGELLREATPADAEARASAERLGVEILDAAGSTDQAVTFLDCEVTLDRRGAVLHALPFGPCNLDSLLAVLSDRFDLAVRVHDFSQAKPHVDPPEPKTTCEKPGCGTAEGGCSSCSTSACGTGSSCSKGKVNTAAELTSYFSDLRQKMESQVNVRTPLN